METATVKCFQIPIVFSHLIFHLLAKDAEMLSGDKNNDTSLNPYPCFESKD